MKTYARVIDGAVAQIIPPVFDDQGREVPIESRVSPEVLEQLQEYDVMQRPQMPEPTHAQLVAQAKEATRVQRQPIISILDGLQSSAIVHGDMARAEVIEVAKQGLRDITNTDLSDCMTFEDMRQKVKARYIELAMALPADIRKAFSEAIN
jgi:hypothetical protein